MKFPLPDGSFHDIPYIVVHRRKRKMSADVEYWFFRWPGVKELEPIPHRPTNWEVFRQYCERRIGDVTGDYTPPAPGTFNALIDQYRGVPPLIDEEWEEREAGYGRPINRQVEPSSEWNRLRKRTRKDYSKHCDKIAAAYGIYKVWNMDAEIVRTLRDNLADTPYEANYRLNVLSALLKLAVQYPSRYRIETNVARLVPRFGKKDGIVGRTVTFELEDDSKFLEVADKEDQIAALYHRLLSYLGQRPGDTRKMMMADYNFDRKTVAVTQDKTEAKIRIKCHKDLIPHIEAVIHAHREAGIVNGPLLRTEKRGPVFSESRLSKRWRLIARDERVGLGHMQPRDNRTTAIVRLAEAGVKIPQICSVSGHSLQSATNVIQNHYWKRTETQSSAAIARLEEHQDEIRAAKEEAQQPEKEGKA